jgi:virulence factor Mce-like protein
MPARGVLLSVIAVALVAGIAATGLWIAAGGSTPFTAKGYRVSVALPDVTGLSRGATVRISGVDVGRVTAVAPQRTPGGGTTRAELEIEPRFAPLPADTRVLLRTASLLGERFVALSPGTAHGPSLPDGGTIRGVADETATVGELLDALDPRTRRAVRRLAATARTALDGRGAELNALLGRGPDVAEDLDRLTAIVDGQRPLVTRLTQRAERTAGAIADNGRDLEALVRDAGTVAATGADRADALRRTVDGLPDLIGQTRATVRRGERLARRAGPTVARLRDGADRLSPALEAAEELAPATAELLGDARPLVRRSAAALPELQDAVGQLPDLLTETRRVTRRMPSFFGMLAAYREQLVAWVGKLAAVTQPTVQVAPGIRQRAIRLAAVLGSSPLYGTTARQPSFRGNAYPAPGWLSALVRGAPLAAWDCRGATAPPTYASFGASPACVEQRPWTFDGATRAFPHVRPLADEPPRSVARR